MSFTELTPVTSCCSSSSTPSLEMLDSEFSTKTHQNIHAFHQALAELDFGSTSEETEKQREEEQFLEIDEVPDTYDEDVDGSVESEDDVGIKYPYERKDAYDGLKERIEQRLNDSGDEQLEKEAKEIAFLVKMKQAEWKEEEKLERQEALLRHRNSTVFTCVMCSKAFQNTEQLQKHTAQAHDLSGHKFRCHRCGKSFKYKKNLEAHVDLHLKDFPCNSCSLVFKTEKSLHAHQLKEHKEEEEQDWEYGQSKCPNCELHFSDKIYKRHVYYCLNKEKIAEKRALKKAQSTPSSPALSTISCASFASYQPGPSGAFKSPLVSPSVVSYRDKSCSVCGEKFASRQSMLRHVGRKHPEVKDDPNVTAIRYVNATVESPSHQYACVDCGKRLTTRAALTTHRARAHSALAGSECPHCQKTFIVPSELRKHIQRVHNKEDGLAQTTQKLKGQQLTELPDIDDIF